MAGGARVAPKPNGEWTEHLLANTDVLHILGMQYLFGSPPAYDPAAGVDCVPMDSISKRIERSVQTYSRAPTWSLVGRCLDQDTLTVARLQTMFEAVQGPELMDLFVASENCADKAVLSQDFVVCYFAALGDSAHHELRTMRFIVRRATIEDEWHVAARPYASTGGVLVDGKGVYDPADLPAAAVDRTVVGGMQFLLRSYLNAGVYSGHDAVQWSREQLRAPVALVQHIPAGWLVSRTVDSAAVLHTLKAAAGMGVASLVFDMSKIRLMPGMADTPVEVVDVFLGNAPTTWDFARIRSAIGPVDMVVTEYMFVKGQALLGEDHKMRPLADGFYPVNTQLGSSAMRPVHAWDASATAKPVTVHVTVSTAPPMTKLLQTFVGAMDKYASGDARESRAMLGEVESGIARYEQGASLALRRDIVAAGFQLASVYVTTLELATHPWKVPGVLYTLGWNAAAKAVEYVSSGASHTVDAVTMPLRMPAAAIRSLMPLKN